jgi:LysR family transcriptional regulator, glycine cleavage system transcriptional activator
MAQPELLTYGDDERRAVTMDHSSTKPEVRPRPPLRSLDVAVTVSRSGSLTAAAEVLGMTHGAVSRHVKAVETWVNLRLFERHGRGVTPTQEGQIFFAQVEQGLSLIDRAADRWQRRRGRDVVRISTTPTFAKLWLLPRLARLEAQDPPLHVDLSAQQSFADIERGEVDVVIRYTRQERLPERAGLFMAERIFPVASPEVAAAIGDGGIEKMLSFPLLHDTDATKWRAWLEGAAELPYRPRAQDRRFEDYPLCIAAAESGLGIALGQCPLLDDALPNLNLVPLPFGEVPSPVSYFYLTASDPPREVAARLLERLLAEVPEDARRVAPVR